MWSQRLFGLEQEYGFAVRVRDQSGKFRTGTQGVPSSVQLKRFESIVREQSGYTEVGLNRMCLHNAGAFYIDGEQPEYCTPEVTSLLDLNAYIRAGDELCARAAAAMEAEDEDIRVYLIRNNLDYSGRTYGTHESYLMRFPGESATSQFAEFCSIAAPFFVSRLPLVGAGRIGDERDDCDAFPKARNDIRRDALRILEDTHPNFAPFQISQKADFTNVFIDGHGNTNHPIFTRLNTENAAQGLWRVHIPHSDALISDWQNALRAGITLAFIGAYEDGLFRHLSPEFSNDAEALHAMYVVSRDLEMDHPIHVGAQTMTALDLQRYYFETINSHYLRHGITGMSDADAQWTMRNWEQAIETLSADWSTAFEFDWVGSHYVSTALLERHGWEFDEISDLAVLRSRRPDLFADLSGLAPLTALEYASLHSRMVGNYRQQSVDWQVTPDADQVQRALGHAPNTRAVVRAALQRHPATTVIDWRVYKINSEPYELHPFIEAEAAEHLALAESTLDIREIIGLYNDRAKKMDLSRAFADKYAFVLD